MTQIKPFISECLTDWTVHVYFNLFTAGTAHREQVAYTATDKVSK